MEDLINIVNGLVNRPRPAKITTNRLEYIKKLILPILIKHPNSYPFTWPVDYDKLSLPDYPVIIKEPMDLSVVKSRLNQKYYYIANECIQDLHQIFINCYIYNPPGTKIIEMAQTLEATVLLKLRSFPVDEFEVVVPKSFKYIECSNICRTENVNEKNLDLSFKCVALTIVNGLDDRPRPSKITTNKLEHIKDMVLPVLLKHSDSYAFLRPVDYVSLSLPEYPYIIKEPMDLSKVKSRFNKKYYYTASESIQDLHQIFINCYIYNPPETEIIDMARTLEATLLSNLRSLPINEFEVVTPKRLKKVERFKKRVSAIEPVAFSGVASTQGGVIDDRPRPSKITTNKLEYIRKRLLPVLLKHGNACSFLKPVYYVSLSQLDYADIIKAPMDLSKIKSRFHQKYYYTASECVQDLDQIFINCYIYDPPGTNMVKAALSLEAVVRSKLRNLPIDESEVVVRRWLSMTSVAVTMSQPMRQRSLRNLRVRGIRNRGIGRRSSTSSDDH